MSKNVNKNDELFDYSFFCVENGFITQIKKEDLKDYDYILKNPLLKIVFVDRDKRKIRPYVENLLNTMDIETKNTKMIKINLIFTGLIFGFIIFTMYQQYSLNLSFKKLSDQFGSIEKVKILETPKSEESNILFK